MTTKKSSTPFVTNLAIDPNRLPQHVAIIMDGNRRWAKANNLNVNQGHEAGAKNLETITEHSAKLGIKHLTVYALSTENWHKRAIQEVKGIFGLLIKFVKTRKEMFKKNGIRFIVLGDFSAFPASVRHSLKRMVDIVLDREQIKLNVALNYGGRDEIVSAIKKIVKSGVNPDKIDEELVSKYLYTHDQPDPDLVIRPGGEKRISNFLLWQSSYAEFYFSDILWPDFGPAELEKAIYEYQQRERRLGK